MLNLGFVVAYEPRDALWPKFGFFDDVSDLVDGQLVICIRAGLPPPSPPDRRHGWMHVWIVPMQVVIGDLPER